jgi:hypothetical protein
MAQSKLALLRDTVGTIQAMRAAAPRSRDDSGTPTPPVSPAKAIARTDDVGLDRPIRGAVDRMTPRELASQTRGPLASVGETNKAFTREAVDRGRRFGRGRMYTRSFAKRPLALGGGRR